MIPCKNCLTFPLCKSLDLHFLVKKCAYMNKYLKVINTETKKYRNAVVYRIFTKLDPNLHRFRLKRIKKYIPHTHRLRDTRYQNQKKKREAI